MAATRYEPPFASVHPRVDPHLAVMVVGGRLTIPPTTAPGGSFAFIPLGAAVSLGMDYFVWRTPERDARLQALREARRPNIRL